MEANLGLAQHAQRRTPPNLASSGGSLSQILGKDKVHITTLHHTYDNEIASSHIQQLE